MQRHIEGTCQALLGTLDFCTGDPGFRDTLEGLLAGRAARIKATQLPWLMLPVLTCEALTDASHRVEAAYHVAAAWELGNLSAALLDAWQDHDTAGALWQEIGPERTVNLAVGLIALSLLSLSQLERFSFPASQIMELQREFQRTLLRMVEGQHADLSDDLSLDDCQAVAGAKAGALFRLGAWAGAFTAGARSQVASLYGDFGAQLGLLIQTWNDLYGLTGAMGKKDVGHRRTVPIVAALALDSEGTQDQEALLQSTEGRAGELYALTQAAVLHGQAAEALARCPSPGRLALFLDAYSISRHLNAGGRP